MNFDKSSIENIYGSCFVEDNSIKLLYKGGASFSSIFKALEAAQEFICLQFYIFRNDDTGTEIARLLRKKAKKGVIVYLLYDHFGSIGTPESFWKELRVSGINVRASRPLKWRSPLHYLHRDHRKLLIVDGLTAFTGGLNIANEYRGFHLRLRKETWRDTGVMLKGPVVAELLKTFNATWATWGGAPLKIKAIKTQGSANNSGDSRLPVIPIFAASARGRRKMRKLLYYSIAHAKKSILFTTAYFTPSRRMLDMLEEAVERGVNVKLLLPGKSDVPAAYYAGRAFFSRLLKKGVRIYNYQGDVLHAKTYVFDDCWSIVGSANLDFMSMRRNDEGNVGILDSRFGNKMNAIFEEDLAHSLEITETVWARRPLGVRLRERFFALFRRRL